MVQVSVLLLVVSTMGAAGAATTAPPTQEQAARELGSASPPADPAKALEKARATVAAIRNPPSGDREPAFSSEVQLYRLRQLLAGLLQTPKRDEALDLWVEARGLATGIPANTGPRDERYSSSFQQELAQFELLRSAIEAKRFGAMNPTVRRLRAALDAHEKQFLHGTPSARGRAVQAEAEALERRYSKEAARYVKLAARLAKDPAYQKLSAEQTELVERESQLEATNASSSELPQIRARKGELAKQMAALEKRYGLQ